MLSTMALTQVEKAEKYEKVVEKKKMDRLRAQSMTLRAIDLGTLGATSLAIGMVKSAKPEWDTAFYGLLSPDVVALIAGGALFAFAGKSDVTREVGAGMVGAGLSPLAQKGGRKIYEQIAA